jgi:hypothetical protein
MAIPSADTNNGERGGGEQKGPQPEPAAGPWGKTRSVFLQIRDMLIHGEPMWQDVPSCGGVDVLYRTVHIKASILQRTGV